jgi:putative transposase
MIQANSMHDHIHMLTAINPSQSVSSIIQRVKSASSKWINENEFSAAKFSWQAGFGRSLTLKVNDGAGDLYPK